MALQKRYYRKWVSDFSKIPGKLRISYLLLETYYGIGQPVSTLIVRKRVYAATRAAIGIAVPLRILRQTCGHIHTRGGDASALSQLGWSSRHSFQYTWLPRTLFTPAHPASR